MPTTHSSNKEFAWRLHEEVWDNGNLDLIDELIAEDYVEHSPAIPHDVRGPADYKQNVEMIRTGFPDLTLTEEDTIAEGDKVVSRITFRGTHDGEFLDIPPTGMSVEFGVIVINRVEDGQLVEAWVQTDMVGLLQQLGVVEESGPEGA